MLNIRKHFPIFLVIVGACAALVVIAVYYSLPETRNRYIVYTSDSVHGMVISAPVEYKGVTIGEVEGIELTKPGVVKIIIAINKTISITTNTRATIISRGLASRGFTGYIYISLADINTQDPPLLAKSSHDYPIITTSPSQSDSIDLALYEMKNNVDELTKVIGSTLDNEARSSLKKILSNMEQITDMLVINNARLNALIVNTEKASAQFGTLMTTGMRTMNLFESQILPEVYLVLNQVNHLAGTASDIANKIEQDPSVLLRGTTTPTRGPGE